MTREQCSRRCVLAFWLTDWPLHITDLTKQGDTGPRELALLSAYLTYRPLNLEKARGTAPVPAR
jgi:hypothetical protein